MDSSCLVNGVGCVTAHFTKQEFSNALLAVNGSAAIWLYDAADLAAEPRMLTDEAGVVTDIAFSPDGRTLATTGDLMLALWDVSTGDQLRILSGGYELGTISLLAFSPDGRTLAQLANNHLMLWDTTTGNLLPVAESSRFFLASGVTDITFNPEGTLFAWSDLSGTVYGWNVAAQKAEFVFRETVPTGGFKALTFSPDGKTLVAGGCARIDEDRNCDQGGLWFWDVKTHELRRMLEVTEGRILSELAYSPDGTWLALEGSDSRIILLDAESGELQQSFPARDGWYFRLAFSPNGTRLAVARYDDSYSPFGDSAVYVWDIAAGAVQYVIEGTGGVLCMAFSADEKMLASAGYDGIVRLWDIQSRSVVRQFETQQRITSVVFTLDGQSLLAYGYKHTMWQWDIESGQLQQERDDIRWLADNSQLSPSGVLVISPETDTIDRVWDPISDTTLMTITVEADPLDYYPYFITYALAPDGKTLA
jgi:WD40 repeat protein